MVPRAETAPTPPEERYAVHAPASMQDGTSRVLKHDETFAVLDRQANIPAAATSHGLYHRGTRHLSELSMTLNGRPLLLLGSSVSASNTLLVVDLSNAEIVEAGKRIAHAGELHLRRTCLLSDAACYERIAVTNYRASPIEVRLVCSFSADFVDVFEVRGTPRAQRGTYRAPVVGADEVVLAYDGLDPVDRQTRLLFAPTPDALGARAAYFKIHLQPQQTRELFVTIGCEQHAREGLLPDRSARPRTTAAPSFTHALDAATTRERRYREQTCHVDSDFGPLNAWIERSTADLFMMISETPQGLYPYAGVPWFSAPFGRDGILTAMQTCWYFPEIGRGVLRFLAAHQALEEESARDAEPGKILHEMRHGEMAALREIPFGRYYGSIDSTPLFVMLAGAYFDATHDLALLEVLLPSLQRALDWIETYGDSDGDGFVEYGRRSKDGLVQQGWKDSNDSVWHADGRDAVGPIALCEVQGYVYGAWRAASRIAAALGHDVSAAQYAQKAEELRAAFDRSFWCEELGMYALALDGQKQPCRVRSSNAGHCLWTEIAYPHRANVMAEALLSSEMFSGWGIRTIGRGEARYNPMSYHNGSIWPHDTALVADGLARYGHKQACSRVFEGLLDLSHCEDSNRLPELFCGFPREPGRGPVGYPVACAPQAWSAAAVFAILRASLGLVVDAGHERLVFDRPTLPPRVHHVDLRGLRVGPHRVGARVHRMGEDDCDVHVSERGGCTEVAVHK